MFRQLKRNAQCIPTRLGGGKHGYLALVLSTAKYNNITGTAAFNRPVDPGPFIPHDITVPGTPGPTTRAAATTATATPTTRAPNAAELAQQKAEYDDNLRLFLEVETVERLLRNLLLTAFDDDYTQALRDATDMINLSIQTIVSMTFVG